MSAVTVKKHFAHAEFILRFMANVIALHTNLHPKQSDFQQDSSSVDLLKFPLSSPDALNQLLLNQTVQPTLSSPNHSGPNHWTVFCDFDGPIVDVSNRYYQTYQLALENVQSIYKAKGGRLRIQPLTKAQFWQMKQERTPDTEIAMRSGLRGRQIDVFLKRVNQIVNQPNLLHQDQLQPGVKEALSLLQSQGARLVLVTLRCQKQATQILQDNQLDHLFADIWGAQAPDMAYANHAQHKTDLLKQAIAASPNFTAACMIGDTEADILAGQAMGIPAIALTCGIRSHAYLQRFEPTVIHPDLLTVARKLVTVRRSTF
jgi:phosphoglycolate phosphatase